MVRSRDVPGREGFDQRADDHGVAPGRVTLTQRLARKPAPPDQAPRATPDAGTDAAGAGAAPTGEDPFGLHLLGDGVQAAPRTPAEALQRARQGTRIALPFRAELEQRFERDFGEVEVFVGPAATEACAAVGAEAFTVGNVIVLSTAAPSRELVAHELTHVVQAGGDGGASSPPADLAIGAAGSAEEQEADGVAAGTFDPAMAGGARGAGATMALKPAKDSYCTTTGAFFLVDRPGGTTLGKLPKGALVKVTALNGKGYDVAVLGTGALTGARGYLPDGAIGEAQGIIGDTVFNQGRIGGTLDGSGTKINCLGHASGERRAAYITNGTTKDMLEGLGFTCAVGDSSLLTPQIRAGKYCMMVYMYMYKDAWRDVADQGLSFSALASKYGWSTASWEQPDVYFGPKGEDRPIDYHALNYNPKTKSWEWVANNRLRERPPDYDVDSKGTEPAAANPDAYFPGAQVLVSIACYK